MSAIFLNQLFQELNSSKVQYCVLRGYESLPEKVTNDLDFGVTSNDKKSFFNILNVLAIRLDYEISIELIRLGVIKTQLIHESEEVLKIDVWWNLNYVGLEYLDMNKLLNSRVLHKSLFYVPSNAFEFSLSFLKELLHNSIIREDKIEILKLKMVARDAEPFNGYFNKELIKNFFLSVENDRHQVQGLSVRAKLNLLVFNLKAHHVKIVRNIFLFFKIRFFYNKEYDYLLAPKNTNY